MNLGETARVVAAGPWTFDALMADWRYARKGEGKQPFGHSR
jgi:hypothetical protein